MVDAKDVTKRVLCGAKCSRAGPWLARIRALFFAPFRSTTTPVTAMTSPNVALDIERARFNMIEQQIRPWDVLDQIVLDLLFTVRREEFLPPQYRLLAFIDMEIPLRIDEASTPASAMFAPKVEARFMQELPLRGTSRCSRSAPAPAIWPRCSRTRRAAVLSIEIDPRLQRLRRSAIWLAPGFATSSWKLGDGAQRLVVARAV